MADPWLTIIGIGEDGPAGLSDASRDALARAEIIFGGPRHLELVGAGDKGRPWPVPFSVDPVLALAGRKVVVLASGDPFWHGAGGSLAAHLPAESWRALPAPSVFSLAAARMGWRIEETICIGLHAAPFDRLRPVLGPSQPIICTLRDGTAPAELAAWLTEQGFGASALTVFEALGGPRERIRSASAAAFDIADIAAPVSLAITPKGGKWLSRASGLADDLFAQDGQITKRPMRALTLSALAPRAGEHLWDIGAGSGSISVEWALCGAGCTASAIEPRTDRLDFIRDNIHRFGLGHRITTIAGHAPDVLENLPAPDAVFIGGGANDALLNTIWAMVPAGTRIVANSVTLESQELLTRWHQDKGGDLWRIDLAQAEPLGRMRGWKASRAQLQWSVVK
ncbi:MULTISPECIES: precorrin-6y C5,15-methyltransferase (decarboxylating) subunit CbiE [unclassified Roseovarius]|uniref:precorrin-6y C5,15-methyltransferase (decarboxylating) subunit CbiE n=1 Tax=unclassified Roseovarius TaxID=2614913 RepID=UPI00273F5E0B|nr:MULTISPECIES: precorrin-6y C5,15-methyltransferase (decarboxylating) subunit CbiE [unclassified Roseovarius]